MKRLLILTILAALLAPATALAQRPRLVTSFEPNLTDERVQYKVAYSVGLPLFDTAEYIPDVSVRGFSFDFNYRLQPEVVVGFWSGWQDFSSKEGGTATFGNVTISGVQLRNRQMVPLVGHATYNYSLTEDNRSELYFGMGAGPYYVETLTQVGAAFSDFRTTWHFGLAPEVGAVTHLAATTYFVADIRWNMLFASSGLPFQSYLNFNVGLLLL